jgi:hypothetical protein
MYWFWVPLCIAYYAFYAWMSKQQNEQGGWGIAMLLANALFPLWIIVSRYSKNLLFDGMLYDSLLSVTYVVTLICLGAHSRLTHIQWTGIVLAMAGLVIFRWER